MTELFLCNLIELNSINHNPIELNSINHNPIVHNPIGLNQSDPFTVNINHPHSGGQIMSYRTTHLESICSKLEEHELLELWEAMNSVLAIYDDDGTIYLDDIREYADGLADHIDPAIFS